MRSDPDKFWEYWGTLIQGNHLKYESAIHPFSFGGPTMSKFLKKKPFVIIGGIAVIAALGFFVLGGGDKTAQKGNTVKVTRPVRAVAIQTRGATFNKSYPGRVKASQEVDLTFRVSGPIIELPVLKGQTVTKGDTLARIDPRDYETNLANTQSALDNARAQFKAMKEGSRSEEIAVLQANLGSAQSQLAEAKANYERYKALVKQGAVSEAEFEKFQTSYKVAQSQVKSAQEQLNQGKAGARKEDLDAMESTIQGLTSSVKAAQDALDDTHLLAPFDARISDRYVEQYQNVNAGQPILHIQDVFALDVVINVPESDLARSQAKDMSVLAIARFDALPGQKFPLVVKEISTQADADSQTYPVTLTMDNHSGINILPGMITEVDITITRPAETVSGSMTWPVPVESVFIDEQGLSRIWTIDRNSGKVRSVQVQIHNYMGDDVFISGNVKEGDLVITAGTSYLSEGEEVRVIEGRIGK